MTSIIVPIRLRSYANIPEHWATKAARQKKQRVIIRLCLKNHDISHFNSVELIRHAPRKLDDDNLISAFKHIRDCIADLMIPGLAPGRADAKINFIYAQQKSKEYCIEIKFSNI